MICSGVAGGVDVRRLMAMEHESWRALCLVGGGKGIGDSLKKREIVLSPYRGLCRGCLFVLTGSTIQP